METPSTSSELISIASADYDRARHLLSLLLSLGRPSRPPELASLCTSFPASPELVHYLCSITNSSISLTEDLLVVPSPVAATDFAQSFAASDFVNSIFASLPLPPPSSQRLVMCYERRKRKASDYEFTPLGKRRLTLFSGDENKENRLPIGVQYTSPKVPFNMNDYFSRGRNINPHDMPRTVNDLIFSTPFSGKFGAEQQSCHLTEIKLLEGETDARLSMQWKVSKEIMAREPNPEPLLPNSMLENLAVPKGAFMDGTSSGIRQNYMAKFCLEDIEEQNMMEAGNGDGSSRAAKIRVTEEGRTARGQKKERSLASGSNIGEMGNQFQPPHTICLDTPHGGGRVEKVNCCDTMPSSDKVKTNVETWALPPDASLVVAQNKLSEPSAETKIIHVDAASPRLQKLCKSLSHDKVVDTLKEKQQSKGDRKVIDIRKKIKKKNDSHMHAKQRKTSSTSISPKDQMEQKILPNFESYIVEEEEGSGGYGTVYRARRKNDGTTVAIKRPHANAHKHHVYNEQRMLEQFGGKNFIIKYEGCFKNGDSDCFVLEHVEHDRPEVLKREIDVFQLQWYGYCMFKALASLHKQGIIHRDVKPGNFLFSRKANKGYLIDFNLAMDLYQKYGNAGKSKLGRDPPNNSDKLSTAKSVQTKDRMLANPKFSETANLKRTNDNGSKIDMKSLRRKALAQTKTNNNDLGSWNVSKSQGADGSGITSAERTREPLPCQGRKELISLVQEARQSQNHVGSSFLSPVRKRVVAPPQNVDNRLVYLTPMPLVSTGICIGGSHLMNKGNGKCKKEGPCVGTKGFRAPEVLVRSPYQGPKVDIWSAGVTLLYLMIGRTPFFGDPEQNIKDIAKLRGSEDLWEVAKLHNRESSFPEDLYKSKTLASIELRDWCEMNTKRPDFLKEIPRSLIDLVEKCLTVNPRLRITADEALKHEFFAPCHEVLKKQRLHRQTLSQDSQNNPSRGKSIQKPAKISQVKA